MDDLISRQEAIDEIMSLIEEPDDNFNEGVRNSAAVIYQLLPAQPERKKGRWLVDEDGNMECPFCGNTCGFGNYCNECGADLRGEKKE